MANPEIRVVKEYETVDVDPSLYMDGSQLLVYPEVLERDYVSIRWKKGRPAFFAGGYVGIIPINHRLTLDVRPKVPLDNLERIIKLSNHAPYQLSGLERAYAGHHETTGPIEEFLIDSFLDKVDEVISNGVLKIYDRRQASGSFPKGRINLAKTIALQARGSRNVAFEWVERHPDTPQNRLLKQALLRALGTESGRKGKKRHARLVLSLASFSQVKECDPAELLEHSLIVDRDTLPDTRMYYKPALAIGKLIVQGRGIGFSTNGDDAIANSLLLDLDAAFEGYIRFVLQDLNTSTSYIRVFDGNISAEVGRKKVLLSPSDLESQIEKPIYATPDVVVEKYSVPRVPSNIVLDMKYKDTKAVADRNDLNQLIAYAASYSSEAGIFIFPSRSVEQKGLQCLGLIAGIPIYQYFINLGAVNILEEEASLRRMLEDMFARGEKN